MTLEQWMEQVGKPGGFQKKDDSRKIRAKAFDPLDEEYEEEESPKN